MSTVDPDSDGARFQAVKKLTNKRQAAKVCDVRSAATLVFEYPTGRVVYVRPIDGRGFYAVGIGSGGGLYMNRYVDSPQVTAMANKADVDVTHSRSGLPQAVVDPKPGGGS